jgi:hypothetical protein
VKLVYSFLHLNVFKWRQTTIPVQVFLHIRLLFLLVLSMPEISTKPQQMKDITFHLGHSLHTKLLSVLYGEIGECIFWHILNVKENTLGNGKWCKLVLVYIDYFIYIIIIFLSGNEMIKNKPWRFIHVCTLQTVQARRHVQFNHQKRWNQHILGVFTTVIPY